MTHSITHTPQKLRDLILRLASHMAYMQGELEAHHYLDDFDDYYWYRESVALRQQVADALARFGGRPTPAPAGERQAAPVPVAIPGEEYHDDMGPVTWWRFPVDEPPWVGTPGDSDWPGYHTHFTPAPPEPRSANALPLPNGEVDN